MIRRHVRPMLFTRRFSKKSENSELVLFVTCAPNHFFVGVLGEDSLCCKIMFATIKLTHVTLLSMLILLGFLSFGMFFVAGFIFCFVYVFFAFFPLMRK